MECECPYCGSTYSAPDIQVDLLTNLIVIDGDQRFRVTPSMAEIAYMLQSAYPNVVAIDDIMEGLYGVLDPPKHAGDVVKSYISRLRRIITKAGWSIVCTRRQNGHKSGSYRLVKPQQELPSANRTTEAASATA